MELLNVFALHSARAKAHTSPPVFLEAIALATADNSSPYIDRFADFERRFRGSDRRNLLLDKLVKLLAELRQNGIAPQALLVGGSFVDLAVEPGDIDALIVYALPGDCDVPSASRFLANLRVNPRSGLDIRFCPSDVGPLLLMKTVCFFHSLYMHDHAKTTFAKGSFLIDLVRADVE